MHVSRANILGERSACDGVLLLGARWGNCITRSLGRLRSAAGATLGLGPAWSLLGDDRGCSLGHLSGAGAGLRQLPNPSLAGGAGHRILYDLNGLGEGDLTSKGNQTGKSLRSMDLNNKNNQLSFRARQTLQLRGSSSQNNAIAAQPSASARAQQTAKCRSSSQGGTTDERVQVVIIMSLPVVVRPISGIDTLFLCVQ